jgi:uncharacterized membrane protein
LHASGEIASGDLVWREGFSDWVTYGSVFDQVFASAPVPAGRIVTPIPEGRGTGGQTSNSELRATARRALSGKWGSSVVFFLLFILLLMASGVVPFGGIIFIGPLLLGVHEYFIRLYRNADPQNSQIFSGFSNFGLGLVTYLLVALIGFAAIMVIMTPCGVLLALIGSLAGSGNDATGLFMIPVFLIGGTLLFIVSIMIHIVFSMVYLIALEEPEKGAMSALKRCPEILRGYKRKLIMMHLVFVGWSLLTIFTLYIGMLWVAPYYYTSMVAFYDDLKAPVAG